MALRDDEPFVDAGDVIAVTARQAPHAIARPVGIDAKAALFLPVNHHAILVTLVIITTRLIVVLVLPRRSVGHSHL